MSRATATAPHRLLSNFSSAGIEVSPYVVAAFREKTSLSIMVRSAFAHAAVVANDTISPIFRAVAAPVKSFMDRISNTGMGMGFLARVIDNSAGNNVIKKMKALGRFFRRGQLTRNIS